MLGHFWFQFNIVCWGLLSNFVGRGGGGNKSWTGAFTGHWILQSSSLCSATLYAWAFLMSHFSADIFCLRKFQSYLSNWVCHYNYQCSEKYHFQIQFSFQWRVLIPMLYWRPMKIGVKLCWTSQQGQRQSFWTFWKPLKYLVLSCSKQTNTKKKKKKETSFIQIKTFLMIFTSQSSLYLSNAKLCERIFFSTLWWITGAYLARFLDRYIF